MSAQADSQTRGAPGVWRAAAARGRSAPGDGWDRREIRVRRRARCEDQPERAPRLTRAPASALRERPPASILATARSVPNVCRLAR